MKGAPLLLLLGLVALSAGLEKRKWTPVPVPSSPHANLIHTDGKPQAYPGLGRPTGTVQKVPKPSPGAKLFEAAPTYDETLSGNSATKNFVTVETNWEPLRIAHASKIIKSEATEAQQMADDEAKYVDMIKSKHCEDCKNKQAPTPLSDMIPGGVDPRPKSFNLQTQLAGKDTKDNNGVSIKQP